MGPPGDLARRAVALFPEGPHSVNKFITVVETTAGYLIAFLALITFSAAVLRYGLNLNIPDGFVVAQVAQGIAICWGIATATYADRHITVDILYAFGPDISRRICDVVGYTVNLIFLAAFSYAAVFKAFDTMEMGEASSELDIPLWGGYLVAALGIVAAVIMAALRWWQVVVLGGRGASNHG